jgi:hypothetical protein
LQSERRSPYDAGVPLSPSPRFDLPEGKAALVVAHPGHELRVHAWLEAARPLVFVLTDGSGHTGRGRLDSTSAVLERAGARRGVLYGRLTDRALYGALLAGEHVLFDALADELAEALGEAGVATVAGDAIEGFNPGHDACRLVLNAALERLAARGGPVVRNYEFPLDAPPDDGAPGTGDLCLELDEAALERKLAAARGYPEMAYEVEKALARFGDRSFRVEVLRAVTYGLDVAEIAARFSDPPYYETYGEEQVAKGIYREVLRFRDHVAPLVRALAACAGAPAA